jgi:hypothetical protein
MLCPISKNLIRNPVRGKFCTHIESFSLESYLEIQLKSRGGVRWRCPICQKLSLDLVKDAFFTQICEEATIYSAEEVEFTCTGDYALVLSDLILPSKRNSRKKCKLPAKKKISSEVILID